MSLAFVEGKWKACKKLDVFSKMLVYSSCVSYMADFMLAFIFPFKPSKKILTLIFLHYVHKVFVFRSLMRSEEKSGCKIKKSESLQTEDRHFRSKICKLSDAVPQKSFESFYRTVNQRRWMTVSNQNGNNFNKYISTYPPTYWMN